MPSICLSAFRVRFRQAHARVKKDAKPQERWLAMSRGGAFDALALFESYLSDHHNQMIDMGSTDNGDAPDDDDQVDDGDDLGSRRMRRTDKRLMEVRQVNVDVGSGMLSGLLRVGEYGITSDLYNRSTKAKDFARGEEHADMMPFYLLFRVQDGARSALLLLQRTGGRGIKAVVEKSLRRWLRDQQMGVRFEQLTAKEALVEYFGGGSSMPEVMVEVLRRPTDSRRFVQATMLAGEPIPEGSKITIRVQSATGFPGLQRTLKSKLKHVGAQDWSGQLRDLVSIYGLDNQADEIKVRLTNSRGKPRTFNILRPNDSVFGYDVTDDLAGQMVGGHPRFDAIDRVAKELSGEITNTVVF